MEKDRKRYRYLLSVTEYQPYSLSLIIEIRID